MAHPKRKHANARTNKRRSHDFLEAPSLSTCVSCGTPVMPHRICRKCGSYKGKKVVVIKQKEAKKGN